MFTCFVPFKEQNLCHITPKLTPLNIKLRGFVSKTMIIWTD